MWRPDFVRLSHPAALYYFSGVTFKPPAAVYAGFDMAHDDDDDENDSLMSSGLVESGRVTPIEPSAKPESSKGHRWKTTSAHPDMVKGPWTNEVRHCGDRL